METTVVYMISLVTVLSVRYCSVHENAINKVPLVEELLSCRKGDLGALKSALHGRE